MLLLPILSFYGCLLLKSAEVEFSEGQAPTVEILSPEDGDALYQYNSIKLVANILDEDDPIDSLNIALTSSLDDTLDIDDASIIDTNLEIDLSLSKGTHTLTLSVTDPSGLTDTDEIQITINEDNTPPMCTLSTPTDGDSVSVIQDLTASGYASDSESPMEDLTVVFRSDIDGILGTTSPDTDGIIEMPIVLSDNIHQLTMTVTDPGNQSCEVSHTIFVSAGPLVTITQPLDGAIFYPNDNLLFEGVVQDDHTDPADIRLDWTSSLDGTIFNDAPNDNGVSGFTGGGLSPGEHIITLSATTPSNVVGTDSINLIINIPPVIDLIEFLPENVSRNGSAECRVEVSHLDGGPPSLSFVLQNQSTGTVYSPSVSGFDHVILELSTVNDIQAGDVIVCTVTATDEYNSSHSMSAFVTVITRDDGTTISPTE